MYEAILQPISNRADWQGNIELIDDTTGEVITDLTGVSAELQVRSNSRCLVLTASTEDGIITLPENKVIHWHFPASSMAGVCAGTYEIGITLSKDGETSQLLIGKIPVIDGIVRP